MARNWEDFDKFGDVVSKYLPIMGEGDNKAMQIVTAVNKIVYRWYNDGDAYDAGFSESTVSCANWLYKELPDIRLILASVKACYKKGDYEEILWALCDTVLDEYYLEKFENEEKVGSIYLCNDGPFEYYMSYDDEEY